MDINTAASRLFNKLKHLDVDRLIISDYNKKYLGNHLNYSRSSLQLYSYILSWSVASANVPLDKFVFLDYGGGTGVLSLLAREFKIGTVIYNDIYDVSCKDAKVIGESIGNRADYYVHGNIDDVISFLRINSISCNAIASYDVIEHIYDIEVFLKKLPALSSRQLSVVMSSGANVSNPRIRKSIVRRQLEVEYKDREKVWGHKDRDCLRAYSKIRKEVILKHAPNLSDNEVEKLGKATRGMIEGDIKKCVDEYLKTRQFPDEPSHPTNTCDPYTGNWEEHLMNPYYLKDILSDTGFKKVKILSGYYGCSFNKNIIKKLIRNTAAGLLNSFIYIFKNQGIRIAPFYTVYAEKV